MKASLRSCLECPCDREPDSDPGIVGWTSPAGRPDLRGGGERLMKGSLPGWVRALGTPALLILLYWIVRYFHMQHFGLYEDDLTHFPSIFGMAWEQIVRYATDPVRIAALREQGHPLHNSFIYLLSGIGWRLSGLSGPYWIGFAVQSANIALFYLLLKRIHHSALAILGTLVYVLYSADTTQAFLTYSLGIHPSLTFLLLALHAYLSDRLVLSYILASFTLLTYETTYLVFLAAPLLKPGEPIPGRRWLAHLGSVLAILAVFTYWRVRTGDDRVLGLLGWTQLLQPAVNAVIGPAVSLGSFVYRPYLTIVSRNGEALAAAGIFSIAFYLLFWRLPLGMSSGIEQWLAVLSVPSSGVQLRDRARRLWGAVPQEAKDLVRIACVGALMLVLAYPLMLSVRPYAISGRDTRVHAAAVVGAGMLLGASLTVVLWVAAGLKKRRWVALPLAVLLGLLAGYGLVIQNDYVLAWKYQREFWRELLPLIPDVGEGDAILVDLEALRDTRQIGANYWNMPIVLEQLYEFPEEWDRPPRVYRLSEIWRSHVMSWEDTLTLDAASTYASPSTYYSLPSKDAVLIVAKDGRLTRLVGPGFVDREKEWSGSPDASGGLPYPKGILFDILFGDTSGE